jgi:hypothetical protein
VAAYALLVAKLADVELGAAGRAAKAHFIRATAGGLAVDLAAERDIRAAEYEALTAGEGGIATVIATAS